MLDPATLVVPDSALEASWLDAGSLGSALDPLGLPGVGLLGLVVLLLALLVPAGLYRKIDQGQALVVNRTRHVDVSFTGGWVVPVVHRAEVMDLSVKTIEITRAGARGLLCKDDIRADITATFYVRVNPTAEDVLKVAQTIGIARASEQATLERLFRAKFAEALDTVGKRLEFEELYTRRHDFKQEVLAILGDELGGYALDDAVIDELEQTPVTALDPGNVLDARGIRKITSITAEQTVRTHGLRCDERTALRKTDVEAREAILALDRQGACAEAVQARGVASVRAREEAEAVRLRAEHSLKAALARIDAERELTFGNGKRKRLTALAQINRSHVVEMERQRLLREQQGVQVDRERQAALARLAEQAAIEREEERIAHAVRDRVVADRGIAKEQERIADIRVVQAARRSKEARCIAAEAAAHGALIEQVERARARARAAEHRARAWATRAAAGLEVVESLAAAKARRAEGRRAELAAPGLARVEVAQAEAEAFEARGRARARVTRARMQAEAEGYRAQGLAMVHVKEAEADAIVTTGHARAEARRERMLAKATGTERQGLAMARVKQRDASATEAMGRARAARIRERLVAEARGLEGRIDVLNGLDGTTRAHDKFRFMADKMVEVWRDLDRVDVDALSAGLVSVPAPVMSKPARS